MRYPSVIEDTSYYVKPTIKIEAGTKSALEPHQQVIIKPYVADDMRYSSLLVQQVIIINPECRFWDNVIILPGLHHWYDNSRQLRHEEYRISRNYYAFYMDWPECMNRKLRFQVDVFSIQVNIDSTFGSQLSSFLALMASMRLLEPIVKRI